MLSLSLINYRCGAGRFDRWGSCGGYGPWPDRL